MCHSPAQCPAVLSPAFAMASLAAAAPTVPSVANSAAHPVAYKADPRLFEQFRNLRLQQAAQGVRSHNSPQRCVGITCLLRVDHQLITLGVLAAAEKPLFFLAAVAACSGAASAPGCCSCCRRRCGVQRCCISPCVCWRLAVALCLERPTGPPHAVIACGRAIPCCHAARS